MACGLCGSVSYQLFHECPKMGRYYRCSFCELVWLEEKRRLSPERERSRYELHQNSLEQEGYRNHLLQLAKQVYPLFKAGSLGLDYGCGPVQAMRQLFAAEGFRVESYDPFFFPQSEVLINFHYDFLLCCEAAEHFFSPGAEFEKMIHLLKPGGVLAVQSELLEPGQEFGGWAYRRDATHVSFFSRRSVEWLAKKWGKEIYLLESRLWILR